MLVHVEEERLPLLLPWRRVVVGRLLLLLWWPSWHHGAAAAGTAAASVALPEPPADHRWNQNQNLLLP